MTSARPRLFLLRRRARRAARRAGAGEILRRDRAAARRAGEMVGDDGGEPRDQDECIDERMAASLAREAEQRPQPDADQCSRRAPPRTRSSRAASRTRRRRRRRRCCSRSRCARPSPSAGRRSRPRAASARGGQAVRANGFAAAAAAMAPRIMPKSVRLEVSVRIEFGERALRSRPLPEFRGRRNRTRARSRSCAPHTVKPNVTLQGWCAGEEHADRDQPDRRPRR